MGDSWSDVQASRGQMPSGRGAGNGGSAWSRLARDGTVASLLDSKS